MGAYMTIDHPDAFLGLERKEPDKYIHNPVPCPKCKGYGRWHLKLDEYGQGKHFNASCNQCNGWGWVNGESKSATCIHVFKQRTIGKCLHEYTCETCGEKRIIDSSD